MIIFDYSDKKIRRGNSLLGNPSLLEVLKEIFQSRGNYIYKYFRVPSTGVNDKLSENGRGFLYVYSKNYSGDYFNCRRCLVII